MKKHTSTILVLLVSACIAATSAQGKVVTSTKTKKHLASSKTKKHVVSVKSKILIASAKPVSDAVATKNAIAAAKGKVAIGAVKMTDSDSLYDAGNSEYLPNKPLFNFGPKSQNIKYDKRMIMAAEIAAERAHKHSTMRCWSYVKSALLSAKVISSRPSTGYAKEAGDELQNKYGFKKLAIKDPFQAPLGAVLVYGGKGAGHVEIRTAKGFVSDFTTDHPSPRPLLGIYVKPS